MVERWLPESPGTDYSIIISAESVSFPKVSRKFLPLSHWLAWVICPSEANTMFKEMECIIGQMVPGVGVSSSQITWTERTVAPQRNTPKRK